MAVSSFYAMGNKNFTLAYFNHNTSQSSEMGRFIAEWAHANNVRFTHGTITKERPKGTSKEEHWRSERYDWLRSLNKPIVTCHHLDDVVETWLFSSMHGNPKLINLVNNNVYRPFLSTEKEVLKNWCVRHDVPWVEDKSNQDVSYPRNRIRHNIVPEALMVNPGLKKVLRKKVLEIASHLTRHAANHDTEGAHAAANATQQGHDSLASERLQ